jgi:hypothetical protein
LGISHSGAKYHVSEILSKLGLDSRKDLPTLVSGDRRKHGQLFTVAALVKTTVGQATKWLVPALIVSGILVIGLIAVGVAIMSGREGGPAVIVPTVPVNPDCPGELVDGRCVTEEQLTRGPSPTEDELPFRGTVNGFTFGTEDLPPLGELSAKCTGFNSRQGGESDAAGSSLDFELTYLPAGARLDYVAAGLCEDDVFLVNKQYVVERVGFIQMWHRNGAAVFFAKHPRDSLRETTINGMPALVTDQEIYMRNATSSWYLVIMGIDINELPRVAAGIRVR